MRAAGHDTLQPDIGLLSHDLVFGERPALRRAGGNLRSLSGLLTVLGEWLFGGGRSAFLGEAGV